MKKIIGLILVASILISTVVFGSSMAAVNAEEAEYEPEFVVDGNLDVWYLSTRPGITDTWYWQALNAYPRPSGSGSYSDFVTQAKVWTAYDADYIYVYVKVWDDELVPYDRDDQDHYWMDRDSSAGDSLEIWLDPDPNSQTAESRPDYSEDTVDGFYNQTKSEYQGDIQLRMQGANFVVDDFHNKVKPGYGGVTFSEWVQDPANFCPFTFDNEPLYLADSYSPKTVASGYGVEARFPRNDEMYDDTGYRLNVAVNNSAKYEDTHYALAMGPAWWMDYANAAQIHFDDKDEEAGNKNPFLTQDITGKQVYYPANSAGNAAGQEVCDKIDQLPDPVTEADRETVVALGEELKALPVIQRNFVRSRNFAKLYAAEETLGIEHTYEPLETPSEPSEPSEPSVPSSSTPSSSSGGSTSSNTRLDGDVTGDGKVNAADALAILRYAVHKTDLTAEQQAVADLNHDNAINAADALAVLRKAVGK